MSDKDGQQEPVRTGDYLDNLASSGETSTSTQSDTGAPATATGSYLDDLSSASSAASSSGSYLDNLKAGTASDTPATESGSYLDKLSDTNEGSTYLDDLAALKPEPAAPAAAAPPADATESSGNTQSADATDSPEPEPAHDNSALKDKLLRASLGTNRGFTVSKEGRKTIGALIEELEDVNPNPTPNESLTNGTSPLTGDWQLLYTNAPDVLSLSLLPGVSVGQIYQNIKGNASIIVNIVELQPLAASFLPSTVARLVVRAEGSVASDTRLNLKFAAAGFKPLTFLGRVVEKKLKPLCVKFPKQLRNVGWIETTYVDEDLRVARALGGSVFVLLRVKN